MKSVNLDVLLYSRRASHRWLYNTFSPWAFRMSNTHKYAVYISACILLFSWEPLDVWNINTLLEHSKISNSNTEHKTVQLKWIIVLHSRSGNYSCIDSILVCLQILRKHAFLYDCSLLFLAASFSRFFFIFIIYRSLLICVCVCMCVPQRFDFICSPALGPLQYRTGEYIIPEAYSTYGRWNNIFEASIYVLTQLNEFTIVN